MNLSERLAEQGIRLNSYANGNYKVRCPRCSAMRKHKADPCLSVTVSDEGAVWKCWNDCGFVGGVNDREPAQVVRLKPKPDAIPMIGPLTIEAQEFFARRKIALSTLEHAGVGCAPAFVPAKQGRENCIAFPYREPGGEITNIKFRTLDKNFAQVKGAKKSLFGWDRVDLACPQLVLCEGEIDALSLTQAGIDNACSIPDGASDRKWEFMESMSEDIARFTRVVIAGDKDAPGQKLAEELARRFGFERCWKVEWLDGCKDANDMLVQHGEVAIIEAVRAAKPYPISGLHTIDEYEQQIWDLYNGGHRRGVTTGWETVDRLMTIRGGELSVVTGIPGHGKSEFIDALTVNLSIGQGWTFAVCSFENPPEEHFAKYAEKYAGMPFFEGPTQRMNEATVQGCINWARSRFFLIRTDDEAPTVDWILDKARVAVIRHGVRGLVIDPYNEIEHRRPAGMTETEYVSDMLNKIKRFARNHDIHVWFVAHPAKPMRNKEGQMPEPSLYDISGSANWSNKADIGIVVVRDFTEGSRKVTVHVKKVRFKAVGTAGTAELEYDRPTGTYNEKPMMRGSRWVPD